MKQNPVQVMEENQKRQLSVELAGKEFLLPFKEIGGKDVAFLDVSGQVDLIEHIADELTQRILESDVEFDTILNPVAKSNALAHAVAVRLTKAGHPMEKTVVARKAKPDEHHSVEASYRSVTTDARQTMYLTDDDVEWIAGKKILLLDDVYGQGGTTSALRSLVEQSDAEAAGQAVAAAEVSDLLPEDLIFVFDLPVLPLKTK